MADYVVPGQCISLGFRSRLLLRVLSPTLLLIAIPLCTLAYFYCRRARGFDTGSDALVTAAQIDLFVAFVLCPTVSKGIFDTWDCTKYELDGATGDVRTFLNADLQIVCGGNDYPEEYDAITTIAYCFLMLWPIGMPLIFFFVLYPNREALRQRRSTRMVQATAVLHKEYNPMYYWWEIVPLTQRLVLTGWVLLIPIENEIWRIFMGLLTAVGYLALIQFVQPYKTKGFNTLSIAVQFSLVCVFIGGAFIKLHQASSSIDSATCDGVPAPDTNDDSVLTIVGIMVAFNFSVLFMFVTLAAYQFSSSSVLPSIRLVATGFVPELQLDASHRYHLFLSHVWSSGQDQMSTLKRELQLLLDNVRVFLDVDDLEEIENLASYVKQSESMLLFLSKGYFFSANCKKEIAATLANDKPVMLLHETDPNRGGTSMEQTLADCPDDLRGKIFSPRHPVIPWLRVKEFKIVSLKMIVSSMLLHQSKVEQTLKASSTSPSFSNKHTMSVHVESSADTPRESTPSADYAARRWLTRAQGAAASSLSGSPSAQQAAPAASHAEESEGAAASAERVQAVGLDAASCDSQCEPPSSVGGSVATAACSGAALSSSSQRNLTRAGSVDADTDSMRKKNHIRSSWSTLIRSTTTSVRGSALEAPDLSTLGDNLYVSGEVMRQQLSFPPAVVPIISISTANPGVARLAQEI